MKNKNNGNINIIGLSMKLAIIFIITGVMMFPSTGAIKESEKNRRLVDLDKLPAAPKSIFPSNGSGMESALQRLVAIYVSHGEAAALDFAVRRDIPIKNNAVMVVLELAAPALSAALPQADGTNKNAAARERAMQQVAMELKDKISGLGGHVEKAHRHMVRCRVPMAALETLTALPLVRSMRLPVKVHRDVQSEGVSHSGAFYLQRLTPYRATGAKVCILDVGFKDYEQLLGTELPETVTTKSFRDDEDIEADQVHGTACAEIVYDMAPSAELFLANIEFNSDLVDAFNWIFQQKVDVVSYSLSSNFAPGDGTGGENEIAKIAREAGVVWVSSAGNEAESHWSGEFNDTDNDGWHNFADNDEVLEFFIPGGSIEDASARVNLKWYDWGIYDPDLGYSGTQQDYDLYLLYWDGSTWIEYAKSDNRQPSYKWPWESISAWKGESDTYWGIAIRKHQATQNVRFDLYIQEHAFGSVEYIVSESSITIPSDSPYVIAVGAVDAADFSYHYYSSQGPTLDGRIKPDICAASRVSTSDLTYGPRYDGGFAGTSASAPHMAGAIALLLNKTPFSIEEIIQIIYARATDMGDPGPDNIFGNGSMNLRNTGTSILPDN
jgi:Subtilase family